MLDQDTSRINNPLQGVLGENTIMLCTDGLDNDGNGFDDCMDPGCQSMGTDASPGPGRTVCPGTKVGEQWTPTENTDYACSDGFDNDGNGYIDCRDNACKNLSVCCVPSGDENTVDACSDGFDNDCDGYIDCGDYSCKGGNSKDSKATPESIQYCESIEYPEGKVIKPENTLEACSDGIDNDGDSHVDCADYSCNGGNSKDTQATPEAIAYCTIQESPENTEEACSDSKDNNLNGKTDCDDPDCANTEHCEDKSAEPPARPEDFDELPAKTQRAILANEKLVCSDGIDNNKNGLVDCAEYRCHILSLQASKYTDSALRFTCQDEP